MKIKNLLVLSGERDFFRNDIFDEINFIMPHKFISWNNLENIFSQYEECVAIITKYDKYYYPVKKIINYFINRQWLVLTPKNKNSTIINFLTIELFPVNIFNIITNGTEHLGNSLLYKRKLNNNKKESIGYSKDIIFTVDHKYRMTYEEINNKYIDEKNLWRNQEKSIEKETLYELIKLYAEFMAKRSITTNSENCIKKLIIINRDQYDDQTFKINLEKFNKLRKENNIKVIIYSEKRDKNKIYNEYYELFDILIQDINEIYKYIYNAQILYTNNIEMALLGYICGLQVKFYDAEMKNIVLEIENLKNKYLDEFQNKKYIAITKFGIELLSFDELLSLSIMCKDKVLKMILTGDQNEFPKEITTESYLYKITKNEQYANLNKFLYNSCSKNAICSMLYSSITNAPDIEIDYDKLINKNRGLPYLTNLIYCLFIFACRFNYNLGNNIMNYYIDIITRNKNFVTYEYYKNFFEVYKFYAKYYRAFEKKPLINFINFLQFNKKDRLRLMVEWSAAMSDIRGQYENIKKVENMYAKDLDINYYLQRIRSLRGWLPEQNSMARQVLLYMYCDRFKKIISSSHWSPLKNIYTYLIYAVSIENIEEIKKYLGRFYVVNKNENIKKSELVKYSNKMVSILRYLYLRGEKNEYKKLYNLIRDYLTKKSRLKIMAGIQKNKASSILSVTSRQEYEKYKKTNYKNFYSLIQSTELLQDDKNFMREMALSYVKFGDTLKASEIFNPYNKKINLLKFFEWHIRYHNYNYLNICSNIINSVNQPKFFKGIVFMASTNPPANTLVSMSRFSIVARELKKRNYIVLNLCDTANDDQLTGNYLIDQFSGIFPRNNNDGKIEKKWHIDFDKRLMECDGINYFNGFIDRLSIRYRMSKFSLDNIYLETIFNDILLKMADYTVRLCEKIYTTLSCNNIPVFFITDRTHFAPSSVFRDYAFYKNSKYFRIIALGPTYELYNAMENFKGHSLNAVDLLLHKEIRSHTTPTFEQFKAYKDSLNNFSEVREFAITMAKHHKINKIDSSLFSEYNYIQKCKKNGKKIICCIGRLPYDFALPKDGGPAHASMKDWLLNTIDIVKEDEDILLLIKPHPNEVKPEIAINASEKLRDWLPDKLPNNVIYLSHNMYNTYTLRKLVDMVIVWTSTATLEYTALGIPVMACSYYGISAYYINMIQPKSRDDYKNILLSKNYRKPSTDDINNAAVYIKLMATPELIGIKYPYHDLHVTNYRIIEPYWNQEVLNNYLIGNDKNNELDKLVNRILESDEEKVIHNINDFNIEVITEDVENKL